MKKPLVVALSLSLSLAACSRSESEQIKHEFVAGCTSSGVSDSQCECTFDKLSEKYPAKVMIAMNQQGMAPDGFVDDMIRANMLCQAGSSQSLKSIAPTPEEISSEDSHPTGVLSDQEALMRDMANASTEENASSMLESDEMAKARYEANWGEAIPEETLDDIKSRYEATDLSLNRAYRSAMERLELASQQHLKTRQREWIKERDQACGTTDGQASDMAGYDCLIKKVDQRIRVIENLH